MSGIPDRTDQPSTGSTAPTRADTAVRVVSARPDVVYAALLDPGALESWLPPEGAVGEVQHLTARVGGGFRMVLRFADPVDPKTTDDSDASQVRFERLEPGRLVSQRISFESSDPRFAGDMRMTWQLEPVGDDSTRVTVTATDVPAGIRQEDHEAGLASSLANLAAFLRR